MLPFYDRAGNAIDIEAWCELYEQLDYVRVDETTISDVRVSTVWIGIDHALGMGKAPMIFETMIFGGPRDCEYWRYSTEVEAVAGHTIICESLLHSDAKGEHS